MGWLSEWQYLVPISAFVIVMNIVAITVTYKLREERRKSTTVLVISLLLSDAMFGAIVLPSRIIEIWLAKSDVFPYVYAYVLFVSAFNSFCLALDRYLSVVKPLWRRRISTGTVKKGLVLTWTSPLFLSLLPLSWVYSIGYNSIATIIYAYVLVGILIIIMSCIVVFQSLVMYYLFRYWSSLRKGRLRRSNRGRSQSMEFKQKLNSSLLCTCLIITTVITWFPTILYNLVPYEIPGLSKVSLFSLMVSSLFDPFLIIIFNSRDLLGVCCGRFKFSLFNSRTSTSQSCNCAENVEMNQLEVVAKTRV